MIKAVGFDLSTYKVGMAVGEIVDGILTPQQPIFVQFPPREQSDDERAWAVTMACLSFIKLHKPDWVLVEDVGFKFKNSIGRQSYLNDRNMGCVEFYCRYLAPKTLGKRINCMMVSMSTMRMMCLGKGKKHTKEDIMAHVVQKYGVKCLNDDCSDALLLLDFCAQMSQD